MAQYVTPPRKLADKTGRGTPGAGDRLVKRADQAVKEHQQKVDYKAIATESLDRLNQYMQDFNADPTRADLSHHIYELCHDLRGEGASFGYPSVSRVAELICKIVDCEAQRDARFLDVVKIEVISLRAMVRYDVKGNPRGIALEVIDALEFLVDTFLSRLKQAA
jgi:chemotaxis protein histidine kinase CheA